jgi:hypothetical protein
MSKPSSPTYRSTNWFVYNEALKCDGSLTIWFDPEMNWVANLSGKRGRSRFFSDAADPDLPDHEGAVRGGAAADDWVCGKSPAADGAGLDRA